MYMIEKNELTFKNNMLVLNTGLIVNLPQLADEVNEISDMKDFIEFVEANEEKISSGCEKVVFTPSPSKEDIELLTTGVEVQTPLTDEYARQTIARAEEFLKVEQAKSIDNRLAKYTKIARWFSEDYIMINPEDNRVPATFKVDPLSLTKEDVIGIVAKFFDPEFSKLRDKVVIDFS